MHSMFLLPEQVFMKTLLPLTTNLDLKITQ